MKLIKRVSYKMDDFDDLLGAGDTGKGKSAFGFGDADSDEDEDLF